MEGRPFREEIRVPGAPEPSGVGTYAVRAGNLIFVQGFTALDEHGRAAGGADAAAQARFALEKIDRCLRAAGATFADVCKVTVFYRNIADREAVNRVRREYFGSTRPASTAVEVSRLVRDDLLVEIEVIAALPPAP
jgi:2-iminobutanoate/2-iminopropanoate deaminase